MPEEKSEEGFTLDKKTMDVLVANIIPTSKLRYALITCRDRSMVSEAISRIFGAMLIDVLTLPSRIWTSDLSSLTSDLSRL